MGVYTSALRPILFRLPAERAHRLASAALRAPLPWHAMAGAPDDPRLALDSGGLHLSNPVGLAAGFDKNGLYLRGLAALGFGYLVAGTVTSEPRQGNPLPRLARLPEREALLNAMGLPNRGAGALGRRLAARPPAVTTLVSVSGETVGDVMRAAEPVLQAAAGIELNVSCPNVRWGRDTANEEFLRAALRGLRAGTSKPLAVKLPPFREGREREAVLSLVLIALEEGAAAITASNTVPVASDLLSVGRGGLSGRPLLEGTLSNVREVYAAGEGRLAVNACGGVASASDALACIRAGASTVQLYTALVYRGPRVVREILEGLLAETAGRPLKEMVGSAA